MLVPLGFRPSDELRETLEGGDSHTEPAGELFTSVDSPEATPPQRTTAPLPKFARPQPPTAALFEGITSPGVPGDVPTYSVLELNRDVRAALSDRFPEALWLQGEVIGFDRNAHKTHVYFQLVDKVEHDDRPRATVNAVLFAGVKSEVEERLGRSAEPWKLRDGLKVRFKGKVDLYPPSGSYQFIVEDIDADFTVGEIARRRERILAELDRLGLRERNLQVPLPQLPLRVAFLTSDGSDAYNDFVSELQRSGYPFAVTVYNTHVQGDRVEGDMLRALRQVAHQASSYDVVVIARGGGSRTDLMGFDSLPLGRAVAEHPLKVLVGIGHERDRSVLDFICHSEKTPTAVAKVLVEQLSGEEERLRDMARRLRQRLDRACQLEAERMQRRAWMLSRALERAFDREQRNVNELGRRLASVAQERVSAERRELSWNGESMARAMERVLRQQRHELLAVAGQLPKVGDRYLRNAREWLENRSQRLKNLDPVHTLARGFAWVQRSSGASVKSYQDVDVGEVVRVRLRDGSLDAHVEGVEPEVSSESDAK